MDSSSGVESLGAVLGKPGKYNLFVLENGRVNREGGVYVRPGIEKVIDLNTSNPVKGILGVETDAFEVMFFKSGVKIYQTKDPDSGVAYDIGVTRTLGEVDFFYPKRKDVFAINQTDDFLQMAISTVVSVDVPGQTVTVRTGDIGDMASSGTVNIRGIDITYSGKSGNNLTGCSGLTVAMVIGDIIIQPTTHSTLPKGTCMSELEGSGLTGGSSNDASVLSWTEPSSDTEPELFYVYPVTYKIPLPRDITAILAGSTSTIIGMRKGIKYTNGFENSTGVPVIHNSSSVHSIPNAFCLGQTDEDFIISTKEGRILPAGQTDSGFKIISNPRNPKEDLDFPIQGYVQKNIDRQDASANFIHYDPASRVTSTSMKMSTGISQELVLQMDIGAWSVDTSKNAGCKTVFKGKTYAGSDNRGIIYIDNQGRTDDTIPINFRMLTGKMSIDEKRLNFDVTGTTVGGLLSATGQFAIRIIADGVIYTVETSADELIENGNMELTTGIPIGQGGIGAEEIGGGGDAVEGFAFEFPIEWSIECKTVQVEIESLDEGTAIEVRELRIDIETEAEQLLPTF